MSAQERIDLINRTARWCFDNTESWAVQNIGTGLAYLCWAIADSGTFDISLEAGGHGTYEELIRLLKANPNGLWETLVEGGFICP